MVLSSTFSINFSPTHSTWNSLRGSQPIQISAPNLCGGAALKSHCTGSRFSVWAVVSGKCPPCSIWNSPTHEEDKDRNLYNLNNAVTQHLTHDVADERFEYANRVTTNVLKRFDLASRNEKRLEQLWTPTKSESIKVENN